MAQSLSDERRALLAREYESGVARDDLLDHLNALPGDALTLKQMRKWVERIGLRRDGGWVLQMQRAGAEHARTRQVNYMGAERLKLLQQEGVTDINIVELCERLNALEGNTLTVMQVRKALWRVLRKAGQPEDFRRVVCMSAERKALLRRDCAAGVSTDLIIAHINALPGDVLSDAKIKKAMWRMLRLQRRRAAAEQAADAREQVTEARKEKQRVQAQHIAERIAEREQKRTDKVLAARAAADVRRLRAESTRPLTLVPEAPLTPLEGVRDGGVSLANRLMRDEERIGMTAPCRWDVALNWGRQWAPEASGSVALINKKRVQTYGLPAFALEEV